MKTLIIQSCHVTECRPMAPIRNRNIINLLSKRKEEVKDMKRFENHLFLHTSARVPFFWRGKRRNSMDAKVKKGKFS